MKITPLKQLLNKVFGGKKAGDPEPGFGREGDVIRRRLESARSAQDEILL